MSFYPPKVVYQVLPAAPVADVVCRRCGTRLTGVAGDAKCPECGLSVALSVRPPLLRYCSPGWVARLGWGATLEIWGALVMLLGALGFYSAIIWAMYDPMMVSINPLILPGVIAAGGLLHIIGIWLLTARDPSGLGEDSYGAARKISRVMLVLSLLITAGLVAAWKYHVLPMRLSHIMIASVALEGITLIQWLAMVSYLAKLALRIRDVRIADRAKLIRRGWAIAGGLQVLGEIAILLFPIVNFGLTREDVIGPLIGVMGLASAGELIFILMYILMLGKLAPRLKEQAVMAGRDWDSGTGFSMGKGQTPVPPEAPPEAPPAAAE